MDRETAVATKRVEDAATANKQEQDDMWNAKNVGLTTRKPNRTVEEMFNAICVSLSDYARSDYQENGDHKEDDAEDTDVSERNKDDEPGYVMGTIFNTVEYHIERVQKNKMKLDQLTQQGGRDTAD